jgi:hypothetical protein
VRHRCRLGCGERGSCPCLDCFRGRGSVTGLSVRSLCPGELVSRRH